MIRLLNKVPNEVTVAVSGGPDSMAGLHFLSQSKRTVQAAFFNHGTEASNKGEEIVSSFCNLNRIPFVRGSISSPRTKGSSLEEYWRNQRYEFFESINSPVITCHHLDDVLEWWVFSSCHGNPKLIPYSRGKYLRPFILNKKDTMLNWCKDKDIKYALDPSNEDRIHKRSYIRFEVIPQILKVNPGLYKVLKKKIVKNYAK